MKKETTARPEYFQSGTTRHFSVRAHRRTNELEEPLLVDPLTDLEGSFSNWLYPGATPDDGAVMRVPAYEGMQGQDVIELRWEGPVPYFTQTFVTTVGRFVDFRIPKAVIQGNSGDDLTDCTVTYIARSMFGDGRLSWPAMVRVTTDHPAPPSATVPDAPDGQLDFSTVDRDVGLAVEFPDVPAIYTAYWLVHGRDGRRIGQATFPAQPGQTTYIWAELLDQVEAGGEVSIWYRGIVDYISPSTMVRIRAL